MHAETSNITVRPVALMVYLNPKIAIRRKRKRSSSFLISFYIAGFRMHSGRFSSVIMIENPFDLKVSYSTLAFKN